MSAYVIGHFTVTDRDVYLSYAAQTADNVAEFGGRFLAKGGDCEWLEGGRHLRNVIIEFPDMATARRWYASDSYKKIEPLRLNSSVGELLLLDGF
ncbi:DUF1330 domain-containing protein [Oceanibium sediminis]|uniref:DUF1330 domain-containing protein n=1 Tax=Oceanibium sediminis TaxID=2026339 RepID=UPI000DD3A26E|nr:DUF1330 domain-containing protein [Oceanibium sediminis]